MPRTLTQVAAAVGGSVAGPAGGDEIEVTGVVTDSRQAAAGSLFVALEGLNRNGADFVGDAFSRGAVAAMVGVHDTAEGPSVRVGSTGEALMRLAADEREHAGWRVLAITGANGKTSTKDLTAAVLATTMRVHSSPGSFNNEIGLPLTLLTCPPDTEVVVAEMGSRHKGDIATLCAIAAPDVVVVTNIGLAHVEIFGSWESIVEAGAEPTEALAEGGVALLNADDAVVAGYASRTRARVVTFGRSPSADVRAERVRSDAGGLPSFDLISGGSREPVRLPIPGEHMVSNALAAAACGLELGVPIDRIASALGEAHLSHWRMETSVTPRGVRVLNDAYNANPESMAAALKAARWMAGEARLIAVLGPMAELGGITDMEHDKVGELAARIRVDRLVVVGDEAKSVALAAIREGMDVSEVTICGDVDAAIDDVDRHANPGDLVLCKASRVAGLERVAEAIS